MKETILSPSVAVLRELRARSSPGAPQEPASGGLRTRLVLGHVRGDDAAAHRIRHGVARAAQVARASGAQVTLAGIPSDAEKLTRLASKGITTTTQTPAELSFDVGIDCSGVAAGASNAMRAVKRGGAYIQVGIFGHEVTVPLDVLILHELTMTAGFSRFGRFTNRYRQIARRVARSVFTFFRRMVSHPLAQHPARPRDAARRADLAVMVADDESTHDRS